MNVGPSAGDCERLSFLKKSPLERLTPHAQPRYFSKGVRISGGHQLCDYAYVILSGACELRRTLPDGSEELLETFGPGAAFGGLDVLEPEDAWTTVIATADTVALRIERDDLGRLRENLASVQDMSAQRSQVQVIDPVPHRLPRQVVTLAFLSRQLPAAIISQQLAQSLTSETGENVVLVRFAPHDESSLRKENLPPDFFLNGEFHMPSRVQKTDAGYYCITLGVHSSEPPSPAGIASLASHLSCHFRHVLIEGVASDEPAPWLYDLLRNSDLGYLFLPSAAEAIANLNTIINEVRAQPNGEKVQLKPIGCLFGGSVTGFDLLATALPSPIHFFARDCPVTEDACALANSAPTPRFQTDIRRLAREISGRLVGLALSSGAAKGFAHIGVIQVLEENGIDVDVVAGSSMGAYVGSIWAYGCDGSGLERIAREMEGRWALWSLIDPVFPPRQGFLRGYAVKKRLMRSIGNVRFSELERPLRVIAGNLATLERVVFSSGEVADAVHASVAVPGICVPITIGGDTYIDGGIVDPLPVDVLREMGVSRVIAVDVIPTPDRIRYGLQLERELAQSTVTRSRRLFRKALPLNEKLNYFAPGNLFEILMRSIQGAQIRVAEASCQRADLVLRPDICADRWGDCARPGKFIALGREIALRHLGEIKALVARKEVYDEREFAPESVAAVD